MLYFSALLARSAAMLLRQRAARTAIHRLGTLSALSCRRSLLCTTSSLEAKLAVEADEAKTGGAVPKVDRADAAAQAEVLFAKALGMVEARYGRSEMVFPKDIMWLAGAPGAGKGTLTPHIMELRSLTQQPIEVSSLLTTPALQSKKERGELVSDEDVLALLLVALIERNKIDPFGVIVDGFPRTPVQAFTIGLLFDEIRALRREFYDGQGDTRFRRPIFHITVLFLPKGESIRRQLHRGKLAQEHNRKVELTGIGSKELVRATDVDEDLAALRYDHFQSTMSESLQVVKHRFHFHFVDADASLEDVKGRIRSELEFQSWYQSSLELGEETFEAVRRFPLMSELCAHARQELVRRLDHNYRHHRAVFDKVLDVILDEFETIMRRQALTGRATIRSVNPVFSEPVAAGIALDVLTERGFHASLDYIRETTPAYMSERQFDGFLAGIGDHAHLETRGLSEVQLFEQRLGSGRDAAQLEQMVFKAGRESAPLKTWTIHHEKRPILVFHIEWDPPKIRRGTASR